MSSVILLLTFACMLVHTSALSENFNLTANELKEKCNLKGPNFMGNVTNALESLREIRENKIKTYIRVTNWLSNGRSWISVPLMNRLCETNPDVINAEKNLIEAIQLCLDEEERLNEKEKNNVLNEMLVCYSLDYEKYVRSQKYCVQDPKQISAEDKCAIEVQNFRNIYELEPIPLVYNTEECEGFLKDWDCKINAAKFCSKSTKKRLRELISGLQESFLC